MKEEILQAMKLMFDENQKKTEVLIGGLAAKIGSLESKVSSLELKTDSLDYKTDQNFEALDSKIRGVGVLVEKSSDNTMVVAEQVADIPLLREEVRNNGSRLDKVEGKLDVVIDYFKGDIKPRIVKLEEAVF